jgi:hypothetical protein
MAFSSGQFKRADPIDAPPVSLSNLRLQIFSERYFGLPLLDRAAFAVRPLAPGLVEAIVDDSGARAMRWDVLRSFGKTDQELFELARIQAAAATTDIVSEVIDGIEVAIANGCYLSAKLLDTFLRDDARKGILVAPISWHHWCSHVIGELTVPSHLQMMRFLAQSIATQIHVPDAERLGTDVLWIKPGGRHIERIEMDRDEPVLSHELARVLAPCV